MIRRLTFITAVAGLVVVGLVAQASAYLLTLPSPARQGGSPTDDGADATALAEPGRHAVGVRTVTADEAPVAMTLWYPADGPAESVELTYSYGVNMLGADASVALATFAGHAGPGAPFDRDGGPHPIVILSAGFAITGSSYAWLGEQLASHGFVVAAPDHRESLDPSGLWRATIERPADALELLDYLDDEAGDGGQFEGLVDTDTVAIVGHSYGGYTALAAAGARLDTAAFRATCDSASLSDDPLTFQCDALAGRADDMAALAGLDEAPSGLWPTTADDRIDAAVAIAGDAAMFGSAGLAEVTVPVMTIGGTADQDSPLEWGTRLAYVHASSGRKVEVVLDGAGHMIFAGGCDRIRRVESLVSLGFCSDPGWDRDEAHDVVNHYVTTFLLAELKADDAAFETLHEAAGDLPHIDVRTKGY